MFMTSITAIKVAIALVLETHIISTTIGMFTRVDIRQAILVATTGITAGLPIRVVVIKFQQ